MAVKDKKFVADVCDLLDKALALRSAANEGVARLTSMEGLSDNLSVELELTREDIRKETERKTIRESLLSKLEEKFTERNVEVRVLPNKNLLLMKRAEIEPENHHKGLSNMRAAIRNLESETGADEEE